MPIISYKDVQNYISGQTDRPFAPVYLIFGEELLTRNAFNELLDALLPASSRDVNYEPLDGTQVNIHEALERVNTYSLLPGKKVVALRDTRLFYAGQDKARLFEQARKAYDDDNIKKAAAHLRGLMGLLSLSFDDISKSNRRNSLGVVAGPEAEDGWVDEVIAYCRQNSLSVLPVRDDSDALHKAVEKGFPSNNHLIITSDIVDKRRSLFKALSKQGVVIDCSVPKGDRRADRVVQASVLAEKMKEMLTAANKTMNPATYSALYEMTGFDLRVFSNNLEKLIAYVGDRQEIRVDDVEGVLRRTKIDPVYELTNAVADRRLDAALFFLDSILTSGTHPLQIFAALVNQTRKLLLLKDFAESTHGRVWQPACSYDHFRQQVIPAIVEYDRVLLDHLSRRQSAPDPDPEAGRTKSRPKKAGKKKNPASDLVIAKNPKNAYPLYLMLKKTERFTKIELYEAFERLSFADKQLKTGSGDPKLVLEAVIFDICRSG